MILRCVEGGSAGWIFNVQRYSIHDGPGIRTTVFLKGCPLRCPWCDNPESQQLEPHFIFWADRCIRCDSCLAICPRDAVVVDGDDRKHVLVERCDFCGRCTEECYAEALEQVGRRVTVDDILTQVEEDRRFYDQSGGGVTLSGGEPTMQPEFARKLLQGCRERGLHTAIETCGLCSWSVWLALLPHLNLIHYDLKEVDPARHKLLTGVSNDLILDNLRRLARAGKSIIIRRAVIPGHNDSEESTHALGRFVQELETVHEVQLLPYHRLGRAKYERLGRDYPMGDQPSLPEEAVAGLRDILASYSLQVQIGG